MLEPIDIFVEYMQSREMACSPTTLNATKYTLIGFFNFCPKYLEEINKNDIKDWLIYLKKKGNSRNTRVNKFKQLRVFIKYCQEEEIVDKGILDSILGFTFEKKIKDYLTYEELCLVREVARHNPTHRLIVEMLYCTGIRVNELANIRLENIDLISKQIFIKNGKGLKSRNVLFSEQCKRYLLDYLASKDIDSVHGPLLINKKGNPMSSLHSAPSDGH